MIYSRITVGLLLVFFAAGISAGDMPPVDDLVGSWADTPEVNGQAGSIVFHFTAEPDASLSVEIDLPPIDAWRVPVGKAEILESGLQIGRQKFDYDAESQTLNGVLSAGLVPVYTVNVALKKTASPPQPKKRPDYGPKNEPLWSFATDAAVWGSPTVAGNTILVGSDDGNMYAVHADSGALAWKFETGGFVRAKPALLDERIFFQSDDGFLYCLGANGELIWKSQLYDGSSPRSIHGSENARNDQFAASITEAGDKLFTATLAGDVIALQGQDGAEIWRFAAGSGVQGTPAFADGRVFFGSFDQHIYGLDAKNGELLWKMDTGQPVVSAPAVYGDIVIIGSRSYDLFGLDASSGEQRWRDYYWYSWVESSATIADGMAYIGSSDAGHLLALDAESGERHWVFDTSGSTWGTPAVDSQAVFIGSIGVRNYLVDHQPGFFAVHRQSGQPLWHFPTEPGDSELSGFGSSPAFDNARVYVGSLDGNLYAFTKSLPAKR